MVVCDQLLVCARKSLKTSLMEKAQHYLYLKNPSTVTSRAQQNICFYVYKI